MNQGPPVPGLYVRDVDFQERHSSNRVRHDANPQGHQRPSLGPTTCCSSRHSASQVSDGALKNKLQGQHTKEAGFLFLRPVLRLLVHGTSQAFLGTNESTRASLTEPSVVPFWTGSIQSRPVHAPGRTDSDRPSPAHPSNTHRHLWFFKVKKKLRSQIGTGVISIGGHL